MKMQTKQTLQEKVAQYQAEVDAQQPTLAEKRLKAYQRIMDNRKTVFGTTDTQNRLSLLPHNPDFCSILNWKYERERRVTRKDFVEAIKSDLANTGIVNPEVIARYRSYLEEDRNTPYARIPLSKRVVEKRNSITKYLFPWI